MGTTNAQSIKLAKRQRHSGVIRPGWQETLDLDLGFADSFRPEEDLFLSPIFLFQTSLPHQLPPPELLENGNWVRRNGSTKLTLFSSLGGQYLPYGKLPRQFLMWLCNTIHRHPKSLGDGHKLLIDCSYRQFCKSVGVNPSTGRNGSGRAMLEQIVRLCNCTFVIERTTRTEDGKRRQQTVRFNITSRGDLAWDDSHATPRGWLESLEGGFELSRDFVAEIKDHKMPVLWSHASAICSGKSPLRIDMYHWLAYRNHMLHLRNEPAAYITWEQIYGQFGSTASRDEFIRSFRNELDWIRSTLWPGLKVTSTRQRIALMRCEHPMPRVSWRQASIV